MITAVSMGRDCDGLCNGKQEGDKIVTDGWGAKPLPGDTLRFYTGDTATVLGFDGITLDLDRAVSVMDNCGIWIGDGL